MGTRVVASNLPFSRLPWLVAGGLFAVAGLGLISIRQPLAPEMNLPPVLLFTPRLDLTPEAIVQEINRRALGNR